MSLTDAYAHVGLPRFQSVEDYAGIMARSGVSRAVLCAFDSSPDLLAIHTAFSRAPDRFRGLGVPLGNDRAEIEAAVRAQLEAGFSGLRLTDADVIERGWLLDILAEHGRMPVVCGAASADPCARILLASLERHPQSIIIGGHFAGVDAPARLQSGAAAELFAHSRFNVVFSRHGAFAPDAIKAWAEAVLVRTGWSRVLWGSEAPVLFWRNETMATALSWVDGLRPTPEERQLFLSGNAQRLYFDQPLLVAPLRLPFDAWDRARPFPATLWAQGLPVEQALAGRLVQDWLASGGEGRLGDHLARVLDRVLPQLPEQRP